MQQSHIWALRRILEQRGLGLDRDGTMTDT